MTPNPHILFILHLPPPVHGAAMVGQYIHDSVAVRDAFDCRFINLTTASGMASYDHFVVLTCRLLRKKMLYIIHGYLGFENRTSNDLISDPSDIEQIAAKIRHLSVEHNNKRLVFSIDKKETSIERSADKLLKIAKCLT